MNQESLFTETPTVPVTVTRNDGIVPGAVLSQDDVYRFVLWRVWGTGGRFLLWVMLNPSTADAMVDDPTVQRCIKFARAWGYDGILIVNLYAYRTPLPTDVQKAIWKQQDVIGADNDGHIQMALSISSGVVVAWGATDLKPRERHQDRIDAVLQQITDAGHRPLCLARSQDGSPVHPMARGRSRVPDDVTPNPYHPEAA